jgi:hypothetical protein
MRGQLLFMTSKITLFVFALLWSRFCFAKTPDSELGRGEFNFNPEKKICLTLEQRRTIVDKLKTSFKTLKTQSKLAFLDYRSGGHPLFIWPLRKADDVNYNEIYRISGSLVPTINFPNPLTYYSCGIRNYDSNSSYNHQSVAFFTGAFGWEMRNHNDLEIIAAAPNEILFKRDGEFDRSYNFNNNAWNAIYVQYNDRRIA